MPPDPALTITTTATAGGVPLISVAGEVDLATAPQLEHAVSAVTDITAGMIIDFTAVGFLSSTGLSVLIAAHKRTAGRIVLVATGNAVLRSLQTTHLDSLISVTATVAEADELVRTLRP